MKLRNILLYLTIILFTTTQLLANTNPIVSNVTFSISGTTVTVHYDVSDAEQSTFTIYMEVLSDGGTTWDYDYGTATGDIGNGISAGTNKTITWSYSGAYNSNFKIKIIADDLTADGSPCPDTPTVTYSGKTYNTIQIADQCWLKENLDVGTMIESNSGYDDQTNNGTIEKYCYDNDPNNCNTYGGLYQWNEAMQYVISEGAQGICPSGWHIPPQSEMQTLTTYANNDSQKLIDQSQTMKNGLTATNETGFSALFAGYRQTV